MSEDDMHLADDPTVHLDDDPFGDDLSEQLAARAPRRLANRATVYLAGAVLLIGGFVAGAQVEKNFGHLPAAASTFPTAFPSGFRGGGGTGGGGGGGGNATTGTVKFVDGTTVYITTASGDTVVVKTDANTTITQPGTVKDLAVGATVTVTGQTGSDGSVTATRIAKTH
jgi:Domain of unknown function (DUF5666)